MEQLTGRHAEEALGKSVVELFSGAGLLGLGFLEAESARYELAFSGEVDPVYVRTLAIRGGRRRSSSRDLPGCAKPCGGRRCNPRWLRERSPGGIPGSGAGTPRVVEADLGPGGDGALAASGGRRPIRG